MTNAAPKLTPMKPTEQLSNEGNHYTTAQSQQELRKFNELSKSKPKLNASIFVKQAPVGNQTIKTKPIESKWNRSLTGQPEERGPPHQTKDWFLSTKNSHTKTDSTKDTRQATAMSMAATTKTVHQTSLNVENVSNSKLNHSNDTKVSTTPIQSINSPNSINNRHKTEPKQPPQINVQQQQQVQQQKFKLDAARANTQINSFNGNDGHGIESAESLHKSITNHSIVGNSSTSIECSKLKKQTITEKRHKHKADAKPGHERKRASKHLAGKKAAADSLQRSSLKSDENGVTSTNNTERYSEKYSRLDKEWHSPESYIYDDISADAIVDSGELTSCMQTFWFRDIPNENLLTREQRLENKRDNLRRQAFQYAQAQHFRSTILAKRRLLTVTKALAKFKNERNKAPPTKCSVPPCSNAALAMTAYCYLHITLNKDQKLFHPCTAKFSDNSQCRVPVFDISHELPLCREHAWKRDNYNRISQEQKPKKTLKLKTKSTECARQTKRNKKKKKRNQVLVNESQIIPKQQLKAIGQLAAAKQTVQPTINVVWNQKLFRKGDNPQIISAKSPALVTSVNKYLPENVMVYQLSNSVPNAQKIKIQNIQNIQNIISIGENSSTYESSEDTGVGELSESELITAPDGIEIPLGDARLLEEHDLTNVLNQLPVDAFNDLFQVQQHDHYEPTQKEQDELARALEEVDEQVKSLEQMTSSSNFLDNFLDVNDEILDGSDICDEMLTTSSVKNDIRNLVHT